MTTNLEWNAKWDTFFMNFQLGVKLPNAWGGTDATPEFKSWVEKGGRRVLVAATDATATDLAVALTAPPANSGTV